MSFFALSERSPDSSVVTSFPGCAATLDVDDLTKVWTENCPGSKDTCTYSQAHRKVSKGERTFVYDEYNVPSPKRNIENGEIDHFYPLCAGGANSTTNLWYQPIENDWHGRNFGFKEKDKLEAWICKEIKAHKLDPQEAFDRLTKDWVKFYIEEFSTEDELKEQIAETTKSNDDTKLRKEFSLFRGASPINQVYCKS